MNPLREFWTHAAGVMAAGLTVAAGIAWRHDAPQWFLEVAMVVGAALWLQSNE